MNICFEAANVLTTSVGTSSSPSHLLAPEASITTTTAQIVTSPTTYVQHTDKIEQVAAQSKGIAKLVVTNHPAACAAAGGPLLQKVVNPPLITVLNPSGPLTVVKSLCVTSGVTSAPHFTFVNSAPLTVTNAAVKSPTITLLNAPVTVVKAITAPAIADKHSPTTEQPQQQQIGQNLASNVPPAVTNIVENRGHNVFVKNTCPDPSAQHQDVPQSHELLTATNFPQQTTNTLANQQNKTLNGQRNKLKIVGGVMMPGSSQIANNILLNKTNQQRYIPRQKIIASNGSTAKYPNKTPNNVMKPGANHTMKLLQDKPSNRLLYPTHKSHIKTIPPVNSYAQKPPQQQQQGVKTISPQHKPIPGQVVQRTGSGLRTIPPQRTHKPPNKPNYIGKHAAQATKMRQTHGKALTAQIIETLSNSAVPLPTSRYDMMTRYDSAFNCPDTKQVHDLHKQQEDKSKSGLDALSLICQAVLLDHNYNATMPPDSPTKPSPSLNISSQVNGISAPSIYSPGALKRRSMPPSNALSAATNLSNISLPPGNNGSSMMSVQDDDAASDISDVSERKHDTEGEETDTAPEAEAVKNENFDGYGDYVTRCICGFLHDDGYMVECDRCKVWQHVQCVFKNKQVPDDYLCEACDPTKPIDRQKARMIQQQWLRDRQFIDPKLRKDPKPTKEAFKPKETISDTDSSDGEHVAHNNNVVNKNRSLASRRKSESLQKQAIARQRREVAKEVVQRRQKRKERKTVRKKAKPPPKPISEDENQDSWSMHLPQLRQWIEKYEEAVTNHYSPELRARISSVRVNGAHADASANGVQYDATVHKCRVHAHPLTEIKFLVSTCNLTADTPVIELRGKYMLSTQHRTSATGGALTTRQHSQRPGPFLFFYRLNKDNTEVCVDTRTYGNSARFIRRSCKPNAELRHCIEKGVLHIYVVATTNVEKNAELTIRHESHDLAAIGTTRIACACGNAEECAVNKSTTSATATAVASATAVKKNGEVPEIHSRKRRKRRTVSTGVPELESPKTPIEEALPAPAIPPRVPTPPTPLPSPPMQHSPVKIEKTEPIVKQEPMEEPVRVKEEPVKVEIKLEVDIKEEELDLKTEEKMEDIHEPEEMEEEKKENVKEEDDDEDEEELKSPVSTRRNSHYKSDREDEKSDGKEEKKKEKSKKLSREERKLEAILRAIEQMEKAESRKQEHQAKQAHRRESEPGPCAKEEDKQEPKMKRRRRKGRSRTMSQSAARRNRLNSTDSYMTSGDENMLLSPNDNLPPNKTPVKECSTDNSENRAVGLLLALSSCDPSGGVAAKGEKSPARDVDSNSNSAHSSPETQLSSACLLVQAAVEPLEQGFKFPKTKKGMMNEWLNKAPEQSAVVQTASAMSPSSLAPHLCDDGAGGVGAYTPMKSSLATSSTEVIIHPRGSAKKRWLRQAISEDHSCDSPSSRPDSPPLSDMVAPPKKRRLPRESLSLDSPPSTPTSTMPPAAAFNNTSSDNNNSSSRVVNLEGCVEIVYNASSGGDSPLQCLESDAVLKERAAKMKQEFGGKASMVPSALDVHRSDLVPLSCMDPRLARDGQIFHTDLVGTVEKTLSILGLENSKPVTPVLPKRKVKLSITEYRQRKKLNTNDKGEDMEQDTEPNSLEENNSSESFKVIARPRSASASSSTSLTSSDDEAAPSELITKAPAFNSEPTELEREREIASLRLKKAFGLAVDGEPRPALNVEAILNLELEPPKAKVALPLPSPTFPIPGSSEMTARDPAVAPHVFAPSPDAPDGRSPCGVFPPPPLRLAHSPSADVEPMETDDVSVTDHAPSNLFYTPDEEGGASDDAGGGGEDEEDEDDEVEEEGEEDGEARPEAVFEETESVSYVPPFNNPVYPNESFAPFSSTIDDEARYEGRNPSPPPHLEKSEFEDQS